MAEYTYQVGTPTLIKYECGKEKVVSYVNSSRYESETAVQTAERKIAEAKAVLAKAHEDLQKAKRNTRFGIQPSNGSILKFEKKFGAYGGPKTYYYGAIRANDLWYITGSDRYQHSPMTWKGLQEFIGDGKVWVPRNYDLMPSA
jgi:hypothetical protein